MATETEKIIESEHEYLIGLYTMFYRKDSNQLQSKNFRFHGGLRQARERAKIHANLMNCKLDHVQPLICDLAKEEDYYLGRGDFDPQNIRDVIKKELEASAPQPQPKV